MFTRTAIPLLILSICFASCKSTNKTSETASPFVQRQGTSFVVNGHDYRFVGTNFWYGAILGSEGQGGDRERLCRELDKLHELGLDNLRILVGSDGERGITTKVEPTLQVSPGVYTITGINSY